MELCLTPNSRNHPKAPSSTELRAGESVIQVTVALIQAFTEHSFWTSNPSGRKWRRGIKSDHLWLYVNFVNQHLLLFFFCYDALGLRRISLNWRHGALLYTKKDQHVETNYSKLQPNCFRLKIWMLTILCSSFIHMHFLRVLWFSPTVQTMQGAHCLG